MKISILIIGLVLLAIYIVPTVILARFHMNSRKRFFKELFTLAKQRDCIISQHDFWNKTAIGIDKDYRSLFYISKTTNNDDMVTINLLEVLKCQIVKKRRNIGKHVDNSPVIEKLGLIFTYFDKEKPETFLEFYNFDSNFLSSDKELSLTEKWAGIVNEVIAGRILGPLK